MIRLTDELAHAYAQMYMYLTSEDTWNSDRPRIVNLFRSQLYAVNIHKGAKTDAQIVLHMVEDETYRVGREVRNDYGCRYSDEEFDAKWPGVRMVYLTYPRIQNDAGVIVTSDYWLSDEFTNYCIGVATKRLADVGVDVDKFINVEDNHA